MAIATAGFYWFRLGARSSVSPWSVVMVTVDMRGVNVWMAGEPRGYPVASMSKIGEFGARIPSPDEAG